MAQYNSKHTGAQIDSAVARALAGGAIDKSIEQANSEIEKRAPAIESADYPGCYYRTVNGVTEWLNPPLQLNVEYRTTERYLGKPVYVRMINAGTFPSSGYKSVTISLDNLQQIIRATGSLNNSTRIPWGYDGSHLQEIYLEKTKIFLYSLSPGFANGDTYVSVYYIKSTD